MSARDKNAKNSVYQIKHSWRSEDGHHQDSVRLRVFCRDRHDGIGVHHVVMHPFVIGELACGNLSSREATLELLQQLRSIAVAEHDEIMSFLRGRELYGRGIGCVDVHLLAAKRT